VDNPTLNFNHLGVQPTQDWSTHHVVFNSLSHTQANLYLGYLEQLAGVVDASSGRH